MTDHSFFVKIKLIWRENWFQAQGINSRKSFKVFGNLCKYCFHIWCQSMIWLLSLNITAMRNEVMKRQTSCSTIPEFLVRNQQISASAINIDFSTKLLKFYDRRIQTSLSSDISLFKHQLVETLIFQNPFLWFCFHSL